MRPSAIKQIVGRFLLQAVFIGSVGMTLVLPVPAIEEDVMVPMRDGTRLATRYSTPAGEGSWPAVLIRSPYNRAYWWDEHTQNQGGRWNEQGYAVVAQNTRGTRGSEGEHRNFYNEGWVDRPELGMQPDGVDTVNWILEQPWCNGRILTYGQSAPAFTQQFLAAATERLAGQVMKLSAPSLYQYTLFQGGVLRAEGVGWYRDQKVTEQIKAILSHPYYDEYWQRFDALTRVESINAPGLHVGGWFDAFVEGTIASFRARQLEGAPGARGNQKLVIQPWGHYGTAHFEIDFPDANFPIAEYEQRFMDYWGKLENNGIMKEPAVHYYVMGASGEKGAPGNEWRTAESWPPAGYEDLVFYLGADGGLTTDSAAVQPGIRSYVFDPSNPAPTRGGRVLFFENRENPEASEWWPGPFDQRPAVEGREDVLQFATAPLKQALEITGPVTVTLQVTTQTPDTDFTANLVDIYPDGRQILMLDGIQRLKLRNGLDEPQLVEPGEAVTVDIELGNTSLILNRGHRLGLHVSSSNYPRFAVNPNTGEDLLDEDGAGGRPTRNTVYFAPERGSRLIVPAREGQTTAKETLN